MSEAKKDGGPAFPNSGLASEEHGFYEPVLGMSLRDWFAGKALEHLPLDLDVYDGSDPIRKKEAASMAAYAYLLADAMLLERDK